MNRQMLLHQPAVDLKYDTRMELFLEIYGIGVLIKSGSAQILEWLRFDFSCFPASESFTPVLTVEAVVSPVPEGAIPPIEESVHSPLFVSYDDGEIRYVDYYGRALTVMDYSREHATLWCPDADFAYEKLYLLVLSRVGEMLDRKGLHRVHGLGFSYRDRGVLILLPMRGGKSTIALSLMNDADVRLFSEDTPLLDREGVMHPFPVRLGVRAGGSMPDIPPEYVREFRRSEHGPKMLISTEALAGHIAAGKIQVSHLIVGKWSRASVPSIRPLNRLSATGKLFRD